MGNSTTGQGIGSVVQAVGSFYGAYQQWKHRKDDGNSLRRQANLSLKEVPLYRQMAGVYRQTGSAYMGAAKSAVELGEANKVNFFKAAAGLDKYEQFALNEARKDAAERVGEGRAAFAANGVLVDSGSAALWEQDEAADFALEQLDIMQQFEDQGWSLRVQGWQALAEGYSNAAGYAGQAASAYGQGMASMQQAYTSALQAGEYLRQARAADRSNRHAWIGSAINGVGSTAIAVALLA